MLGVGMQRRESIPLGPAMVGGNNQTSLGFRLAWDHAPRLATRGVFRDQWTVALSTARNTECDEQTLALGCQRVYWDQGPFRLHAGVGAELRGSRRIGKDFDAHYKVPATAPWDPPGSYYGASIPVQLGGTTVWEARPALRAFVGFRGIPIPFFPFLLVWGRQPGQVHSLTRFEVALPLWKEGGTGSQGMLRKLAPGPEFNVSMGVRFNAPF
ncbi:MAG TPA: hypothetical protein VJ623_03075 [Holophagaceae bacterium]|nr:hypothetical protein [Holophagaceae bacterium]